MKDISELSDSQILSCKSAERLFSRSQETRKRQYHALVQKWHPDILPDSRDTYIHETFLWIQLLYKQAEEKDKDNTWNEPAEKIYEEIPGLKKWISIEDQKSHCMSYDTCREFELGTMYICDTAMAFDIDRQYEDLWIASQAFKPFYKSVKMEEQMGRYFPKTLARFKTAGGFVHIFAKTKDLLLLRDVVNHTGGKLENPGAVGWIMNRLYNLSCFLSYNGIGYAGITPDSVFISPENHSILITGAYYWNQLGCKLRAAPAFVVSALAPDILRSKTMQTRIDLDCIKSIGQFCLGDDKSAKNVVNWLKLPSRGDSIEDFKTFKHKVLPADFGPPKFIKWGLSSKDLYK